MRRVYKCKDKYLSLPIKVMYKLRKGPRTKHYNLQGYEDRWICGYYFPDCDMVNIIMPEIQTDYYEDEEGYTDEHCYYGSDYIPAKDDGYYLIYRLGIKNCKQLRFLEKFPRENCAEVRDTFPEEIYARDGHQLSECDLSTVDQENYYNY